MKNSLATLQKHFFESVTRPSETSVSKGLKVYRNGYRLRLIQAVEDDFPVSLSLIDGALKRILLDEFVAQPRSTTFTLNAFGATWLEFWLSRPEISQDLRDLAAYEWARVETLFADDPDARPARTLTVGDSSGMEFELSGNARFFTFSHPAHRMWTEEALLPPEEESLVMWSNDGDVTVMTLASENAALAQALVSARSPTTLEDVLGGVTDAKPEVVQRFMAEIVSFGLVRPRSL